MRFDELLTQLPNVSGIEAAAEYWWVNSPESQIFRYGTMPEDAAKAAIEDGVLVTAQQNPNDLPSYN